MAIVDMVPTDMMIAKETIAGVLAIHRRTGEATSLLVCRLYNLIFFLLTLIANVRPKLSLKPRSKPVEEIGGAAEHVCDPLLIR